MDYKTNVWIKLELNPTIPILENIRALSYKNGILLFGGIKKYQTVEARILLIDFFGKQVEKFCEHSFIPIEQGGEPQIIDKYGRIFTVVRGKKADAIWMFNGVDWTRVI